MNRINILVALTLTTALSACDLAPRYVRSVSDFVAPQWPAGAAYAQADDRPAGLAWRTLVGDERLRTVIDRALAHNQDLAAAVANVASARAQYRTQRSAQFPTISADAGASIQRGISGGSGNTSTVGGTTGGGITSGIATSQSYTQFTGSLGISSFELDLFGRQKNLSRQAFEQYLATDSGARSTRLTLIAETATAYVTLASDTDLLRTATEQVASAERTVRLTRSLHDAQLVNGSDVANAATVLAQAQSDVESTTTQVAQDRNALELLTGGKIEDALLPTSMNDVERGIGQVPPGLSSTVLLNRPDVVEAEHQLKGAYASIGAARAAFFPTISLTTALGVLTPALGQLFSGSSTTWSANPSISLPIIGGTNRGNLDYAKAQRDYYLATYRKAAQTAYREVADGLARRGTIDRQRAAQARLLDAATTSYRIADARYREGADTFLNALVAQRTLYTTRQTVIAAQLSDLSNRITLYQSLGADATL